jgi:hypothetical protein
MIALRDNLPLIQLADGHAVAFEREWLVRSLARAAHKAGYANWWLAEHVAESVTEYLRGQREVNVLSVGSLAKAVRAALEVIGYREVARCFEPGRPRVRVSLVEIAREAGAGYELAFFDKLGRVIRELVSEQACDFELHGLERCVKTLRSRKFWNRECAELRDEIISFIRSQSLLAAGEKEVTVALA